MYLNKAIIIGNLTRDPDLKSLPSGIKVTSFSIATNRTWKDKNGAKQDATEFHNIVAFGKQAELIAQYMKKGSSIYVEGRMQTRSWDDKATGEKKYRTEIILEAFQFGPRTTPGGGSYSGGEPKADNHKESSPEVDTIQYPEEESNPEDIPF